MQGDGGLKFIDEGVDNLVQQGVQQLGLGQTVSQTSACVATKRILIGAGLLNANVVSGLLDTIEGLPANQQIDLCPKSFWKSQFGRLVVKRDNNTRHQQRFTVALGGSMRGSPRQGCRVRTLHPVHADFSITRVVVLSTAPRWLLLW